MGKEFNLKDLRKLSKRLNEDPSLIEKDWRHVFYDTFELTETQKGVLDELEKEDYEKANFLQETFSKAAAAVRNGGKIKLRVSNDLDLNRRVLRLEITKFGDDTTLPRVGETGILIACCCAWCDCWHWCWRPNPCPNC